MSEAREAAIARASEEFGLASYYRDLVRPILRMPRERWPECCAGRCEPCLSLIHISEPTRPY